MVRLVFAARKKLMIDDGTELHEKVMEVEEEMGKPLDVFGDEELNVKYSMIMALPLEERRLLIVWSLFDCSVAKVANLFNVDRHTVDSRLKEIFSKIKKGSD